MKNMVMPPGLVSNLQEVLSKKAQIQGDTESADPPAVCENDDHGSKPVVFVTNSEGIDSPGLTSLVEALVARGTYNVNVCAPHSEKSLSGHSVTFGETISVTSAELKGATAYEVSGTPVDCVSLALSGALFAWSKPVLVISGVNRGSSCGHQMFYSSVVAGAREALLSGVPSLSISLNWKKDESQESDFKDAVSVCMPLITAAIRDIEKGVFPKSSLLNIEVPTSPTSYKGFKVTRQSLWRSAPSWLAISGSRQPSAGRFMSNQQSLGLQLAQLSRDASAAGAARRLTTQKKNLEVVESVGAGERSDPNRTVKYFRLELIDSKQDDMDGDLDFKALENGFVAVTPISVTPFVEPDTQTAASEWISAALHEDQ